MKIAQAQIRLVLEDGAKDIFLRMPELVEYRFGNTIGLQPLLKPGRPFLILLVVADEGGVLVSGLGHREKVNSSLAPNYGKKTVFSAGPPGYLGPKT